MSIIGAIEAATIIAGNVPALESIPCAYPYARAI
jgi:hypothetical protein